MQSHAIIIVSTVYYNTAERRAVSVLVDVSRIGGSIRYAMSVLAQGASRYKEYKLLVHTVASHLGPQDVISVGFIHDLPVELRSKGPLEVLQHLERNGLFSDARIEPLEALLKGIVRHDLVNNFVKAYKEKHYSELQSVDAGLLLDQQCLS